MDSGDRPHPLHALHFAAVMLVAVLAAVLSTNVRRAPGPHTAGPVAVPVAPAEVELVTRFPDVSASYPGGRAADEYEVIGVSLGVEGSVDRCLTCHRFDERADLPDPRVPATWQPYGEDPQPRVAVDESWLVRGAHPGGWLNWHPPKYFGCVSCHGGDGAALSFKQAGHRSWDGRKPWQPEMVDTAAMLARCGRCHTGGYVAGAERLWRGRKLIREYNCAACHEVSEHLRSDRQGPSLARVGEKLEPDLLTAVPNNPGDLLGSHSMPQFRLAKRDRNLLAIYLSTLRSDDEGPAASSETAGAAANAQRGLELVRQARCANCHVLPAPADSQPGDLLWEIPQGTIGPALTGIDLRHGPEWTAELLADPKAWYPETRMPDYPDLSESDRRDIAAWLHERSRATLGADPVEQPAVLLPDDLGLGPQEAVDQGRTLFISNGCASCHDTGDELVEQRKIGLSLLNVGDKDWSLVPEEAQHFGDLYSYFRAKLADPTIVNNALMPQFDLTEEEIEAIAVALLAEGAPPPPGYTVELWNDSAPGPEGAVEIEQRFWDWPLSWQGTGDSRLSVAERELTPESCATCHREQYAQWQTSRHALSMGPGMTGQLIDAIADDPSFYYSCMRCHARLSEQLHLRKPDDPGGDDSWEANPHFRKHMYEAAHGCANCHVRGHERYSLSEPRQDYLWDSEQVDAHPLTRTEYLEQSTYCRDCHQFETDNAVAPGLPPRENTYREWEEWYTTAEEPKTCQECHMPDGDHSFKGIHDADYVAENVTVDAGADLADGVVSAWITLENTGGGHHLPTYITPKIYFRAVQLDGAGAEIPGTFDEYMLGRHSATRPRESGRGREWFDHYDTRIPAGEAYTYLYSQELDGAAKAIHLQVFVAPDDFYHKAYAKWVENESRSGEGRALLGQALEETRPEVSGFHLLDEVLELPSGAPGGPPDS